MFLQVQILFNSICTILESSNDLNIFKLIFLKKNWCQWKEKDDKRGEKRKIKTGGIIKENILDVVYVGPIYFIIM